MKIFKLEDIKAVKNPTTDQAYRPEILTADDGAKNLGGMCGIMEPGAGVPYHYHEKRELILIIVSGEAIETVEGKDYELKAGDVLFMSAKEKHRIRNKSNTEQMRFIEFFTEPPLDKDYVAVEE